MMEKTVARGFRPDDPKLRQVWAWITENDLNCPPGLRVEEDPGFLDIYVTTTVSLWGFPLWEVQRRLRLTHHHLQMWDGSRIPLHRVTRYGLEKDGVNYKHAIWVVQYVEGMKHNSSEPDDGEIKEIRDLLDRVG